MDLSTMNLGGAMEATHRGFGELFAQDWLATLPEIFLVVVVNLLLVYGVIYSTSKRYGHPLLIGNVSWLSVQTAMILVLLLLGNPLETLVVFNGMFVVDSFATIVKVVVSLGFMASLVLGLSYVKLEKINGFELPLLMMLAVLGMFLMVSSHDLLAMYLAMELQSFSLYILASFRRQSEFSTEAGLKYFILGAFSSGLLLFGISFVYGFTGTTQFEQLFVWSASASEETLLASSGVLLGLIFVATGLLFKMSAAPFHMWAPDVYEGAPTSITAFFAMVPKIAVLALLVRLCYHCFYDLMLPWQQLFILCSIASMVVGTLGALRQRKIKRLLAFSAIGHVGYLLIGFATGTIEGIQSMMLYMMIYMVMTFSTFAVLLASRRQGDESRIKYISDLSIIGRSNPVLAITLALTLFSMAGIPPLAGFFSKMYLFMAAIGSSMYALALVGVLTSVVGCFYYIRLIKIMYFEPIANANFAAPRQVFMAMGKEQSILLGLAVAFLLLFIAYPAPLLMITHQMALTFCV